MTSALSIDRPRLARRIAEWTDPNRKGGPAKFVSLFKSVADGHAEPVTFRHVPQAPKKAEQVDRESVALALVDDMVGDAEVFAAGATKLQKFFLGAHETEDRGVAPFDQVFFNVIPQGDFARSEDVNPADLIGTLARDRADTMSWAGRNLQAVIESLEQQRDNALKRYEALASKFDESLREREGLLSQKAERELLVRREQFKIELMEKGVSAGLMWLMTKFQESEKPGDDSTPKATLDIDPVEFLRFFNVLNPEQAELGYPIFNVMFKAMPPDTCKEIERLQKEARQQLAQTASAGGAS